MGPVRRGLALGLLYPSSAWAGVCEKVRPQWLPGQQTSPFTELAFFVASPVGIALLILLIVATLVKSRLLWAGTALAWGATTVALLLAATFGDPTGLRDAAVLEGCLGPTYLSNGFVAAITLLTLYMALRGPIAKEA